MFKSTEIEEAEDSIQTDKVLTFYLHILNSLSL